MDSSSKSTPWLLIGITFSAMLVAGLALSLATDNWMILPIALVAHFLGTVVTVVLTGKALAQQSKPDPLTEAKIEDREGVRGEQPAADPADKPHEANPTF